jgi:hypothetical protein
MSGWPPRETISDTGNLASVPVVVSVNTAPGAVWSVADETTKRSLAGPLDSFTHVPVADGPIVDGARIGRTPPSAPALIAGALSWVPHPASASSTPTHHEDRAALRGREGAVGRR